MINFPFGSFCPTKLMPEIDENPARSVTLGLGAAAAAVPDFLVAREEAIAVLDPLEAAVATLLLAARPRSKSVL